MSNLSISILDSSNRTDYPAVVEVDVVDGPFNWQQVETSLSISASNGRTWTVVLRTFDVVAFISAVILLAFAIDRYCFNSRYLVRVGGAPRAIVSASIIQEKHEPDLESGRKDSYKDENKPQPPQPPQPRLLSSEDTQPGACRWSPREHQLQWLATAHFPLAPPFYPFFGDEDWKASKEEKTPISNSDPSACSGCAEKSSDQQARSSSCSRRCQLILIHHPWVLNTFIVALRLCYWPVMCFSMLWNILFWPLIFIVVVLCQGLQDDIIHHDESTAPKSSLHGKPLALLALKCFLHLAVWTIAMTTLLLRTSPIQDTLWRSFRWTHAISWWLFWGFFESYYHGRHIMRMLGWPSTEIGVFYYVAVVPWLTFAYFYSGFVCDVASLILIVKSLRKQA